MRHTARNARSRSMRPLGAKPATSRAIASVLAPPSPRTSFGEQAIAKIYAGRAIGSTREEASGMQACARLAATKTHRCGDVDTLLSLSKSSVV